MKKSNIKNITLTAMLSALAYLITFVLKFKVLFLTFDLKDAIISIVSLLLGPTYGVFSAGLVAVLEFITISDTGVYGFVMNFLSSSAFALTCGIIYKHKRTFSGAILSVSMSVITVTSVMLLANLFITPFYMGVPISEVAAMLPKVLLPFNLSKALLNSAFVLIIYKPVKKGVRRTGLLNGTEQQITSSKSYKTVVLAAVSVVVIVLTVLFLVLYLGGTLEFI